MVGLYEGSLSWTRHSLRLMRPSIMRQAILDRDRDRQIDSGFMEAMRANPANDHLKTEWEHRIELRRPRTARTDSIVRAYVAAHPADTAFDPRRARFGQSVGMLLVMAVVLRFGLGLIIAVPFTLVALTVWWLVRQSRLEPQSHPT